MHSFMPNVLKSIAMVKMELRNVFYVSYTTSAKRIKNLLPPNLQLSLIDNDTAFISLVILTCHGVHISAVPFIYFTYSQINIRTYVVDPLTGQQSVYFLKSAVSSPLISFITRSIGLLWEYVPISVGFVHAGNSEGLLHSIGGDWSGNFSVEVEETSDQLEKFVPFKDLEQGINFLVRPLIGLYGTEGNVGRFKIWHPPIMPKCARLKSIKFPLLNKMEVIDTGCMVMPHSVLCVSNAQFTIFLPPEKIRNI